MATPHTKITPSRLILILCFSMAATLGCDPSPPIQIASGTNLTQPITAKFEVPKRVEATKTPTPEEEKRLKEYNALLDAFLERADEAFAKTDTEGYLPGLERFFFSTGRTFEMMDLYRSVYDKNGPSHYITPRLAWAYISVGQNDAARRLADAGLKNRPNDPMVHFVNGYLVSRSGEPDATMVRKVRASWSRALELDPNFNGPAGITGRMLRTRINEMDKALERSPSPPPTSPQPTTPQTNTPTPDAGQNTAPTADAENIAAADTGTEATPDTVGEAIANAPEATPDAAAVPEAPPQPPKNPKLIEGEASLALGKFADASQAFQEVLKVDPRNRRAEYGFTVSIWKAPGEREEGKAKELIDRVAARPDLEARELYELGIIYQRKLNDREKATALWRRAKERDPAFATSVGLDKLLK